MVLLLQSFGFRAVASSSNHHRITIAAAEADAATEIKWAEKLQSPSPLLPLRPFVREDWGRFCNQNRVVWKSLRGWEIPQFSEAKQALQLAKSDP